MSNVPMDDTTRKSLLKNSLLALNANNKILDEELNRRFDSIKKQDLALAGDNAKQREILNNQTVDLRVAAKMVKESSEKFTEACKALLENDDLPTAHKAYEDAASLQEQTRSVLSYRQPVTKPAPASTKEPVRVAVDVPTPPAPKVNKPKDKAPKNDDLKVAGTPVSTPAPQPSKAKDEEAEPAWARKLGEHVEACNDALEGIRKGILPEDIRTVLTKRDAKTLEAALTSAEKAGPRMDKFDTTLASIQALAELFAPYTGEQIETMLAWLSHKAGKAVQREELFGRFWNVQDTDSNGKRNDTTSTPTASPAPKDTLN